jgi:hypothetical protein
LLIGAATQKMLRHLMRPVGEDVLQRWPVAKTVNSSRVPDDDATLIAKFE